MKKSFRLPMRLSIVIVVLSIIASVGGLFWDDLYKDSLSIQAVWFANDIITLCIVVPILLAAMVFSMRGSRKAQLIWIGCLWYMMYNYFFYLYGAVFNKFFLLYVLLFSLSTYGLIFTSRNIDVNMIKKSFSDKTPTRFISSFLFFFAFALGLPWILMTLKFIFLNEVPPFEMTVVFATDLSFLVSVLIVSGALLWKQDPWGYVLAAMIMLKGTLYPMVLLIGGVISYIRVGIWDMFILLYVFLWLMCMFFLGLLLKNLGSNAFDEA